MIFPDASPHPVDLPSPVVKEPICLKSLAVDAEVRQVVEGTDWAFTNERTDYLSHDLHPYPSKFIPHLPCNLITALSLPGELIWDPFGGSGTTAFEALRLGRRSVSTDANPIATEVARAKCVTLSPEQMVQLGGFADRILALGCRPGDADVILGKEEEGLRQSTPAIPHIEKWFHRNASRELAYILKQMGSRLDERSRWLCRACLSSIVVRASWQDSETRYASRPREVAVGEVLTLFGRALRHALEKHRSLQKFLGYRAGAFGTVDLARAAEAEDDLRALGLEKSGVDLVVTSPPYANANDYHLYHRFRLYWLGYDPLKLASCEIGSHLRHQRENAGYELYLAEMERCLSAIGEYLRPGRLAAFVVGSSVFGGKVMDGEEQLTAIGLRVGLRVVARVERPVHESKRSFMPAARRARKEAIVILRRPAQVLRATLLPLPYRPWPYESRLARWEASALLERPIEGEGIEGLTLPVEPYDIDSLRRLTFTHQVLLQPTGTHITTWQAILENGNRRELIRTRKDPKYVTHGIHAYKGKFYPQLAKSLLNLAGPTRGMTVLDPYCGSGTVLLEAQLNGLRPLGIEMNPLAVLIARAKTALPSEDLCAVDNCICEVLSDTQEDQSRPDHIKVFPSGCRAEILSWFPPRVASCIGWLLEAIGRVPIVALQDALKVCLSSIVRQVSQQDPRDLRRRRRKEAIEDAPTLSLFRQRVQELRERLRAFAVRVPYSPFHFIRAAVYEGDSRLMQSYLSLGLKEGMVDVVVTSPPYATALPYIDTDRLSILAILGIPAGSRAQIERSLTGSREIQLSEQTRIEERIDAVSSDDLGSRLAVQTVQKIHRLNSASEVGFRRKRMAALMSRYFSDLFKTVRCLGAVTRPGGHLFFVMGNSRTLAGGEDVLIDSATALEEMGITAGWKLVDRIPISVTTENLRHVKNAITENVVLWFRTPGNG